MTKRFCDLCGADSDDKAVGKSYKMFFGPELRNGGKATIEAVGIFRLHSMPERNEVQPDLCAACASKLLRELSNIIDHNSLED